MFLKLMEGGIFVLMFGFMLTQVIAPIWCGTILFPFFRSKTNELNKQIAKAKDEDEAVTLELEVKNISKEIRTKRRTKLN